MISQPPNIEKITSLGQWAVDITRAAAIAMAKQSTAAMRILPDVLHRALDPV